MEYLQLLSAQHPQISADIGAAVLKGESWLDIERKVQAFLVALPEDKLAKPAAAESVTFNPGKRAGNLDKKQPFCTTTARMKWAAEKKRVAALCHPASHASRAQNTASAEEAALVPAASSTSQSSPLKPHPAGQNRGKKECSPLKRKLEALDFLESIQGQVLDAQKTTMQMFPDCVSSTGQLSRWRKHKKAWELCAPFLLKGAKEIPDTLKTAVMIGQKDVVKLKRDNTQKMPFAVWVELDRVLQSRVYSAENKKKVHELLRSRNLAAAMKDCPGNGAHE